ncbi:microtubule-associated protein futsch [Patella vulgata]|uniref:microtubule-associated protein futsch n=1 Tax=Patella vulgata TaxID=6465 RepID=UPI00217F6B20|nr:microtubule-associated protein futsch [Patella vulgata]
MATNSDNKIHNEDEITTNSSETNSETDSENVHNEDGVDKVDNSGENGVESTCADDIEINGESKSKKKVKNKSKSKKKRKIKKKESVDVSDTNENSFQTISEEGSVIGRSKKLRKRPKVPRRHINIDGAIEKKIEQKYIELEGLLNRQFVEKKTNLTHQHIGQMEVLRQQYNLSCHGLPPTGPYAYTTGSKQRPHSAHVRVPSDSDEAYSTIRTLQHFTKYRPPRSHIRSKSAKSRRETCSDSESYRPKRIDINLDTTSLNSSRSSTRPSRKKSSDRGSQRSKSRSSGSPSPNTSPGRLYVPTDHKLKETENPKIKQWLHKKNLQLRKQKATERAEKREKRQDSMMRESVKQVAHEAGKSKVQEWMRRKRREAYEQAKAEREQQKRLEQQKQEEKEKRTMEFVEGKSWMRPVSGSRKQNAGESSIGEPSTSTNTENVSSGPIPHPPNSKMMYKRSPAGRIRLKVKPKEETVSPEGTDKSTEESQMSYSEWLKKKRVEDTEKKKTELEAKAKAEPDPDLKVLLPEMSQKRINRVTNSKRSVDSGLKSDDGGCSDSQISPDPDDSASPVLKVNGAKATLTSRSGYIRPQSALAKPPVPQPCKSPKRPRSAHPRVDAIMNEDDDEANTENPFKLPFPAHLGLPSEVAKAQSKIFPDRVAEERRSLESMRLEPQGCDSSLAETKPIVGKDEGEINEESPVEDDDEHVTESEKEETVEEPVVGAAFFTNSLEDDTPAETKVPPESKAEDDVASGNDNQYFLEKSLDKREPDKQSVPDRKGESSTVEASVEVDQVNVTELPSEQIPVIQDPAEAHDKEEEDKECYYEEEDEEAEEVEEEVGGGEGDVQNEIAEDVPKKPEITGETVKYQEETSLESNIPDTDGTQKDDNNQSFLEQGHPKREPDKDEECRKPLLEQVVDALPELEEEGPDLPVLLEEQSETTDEPNDEKPAADEVEQTTIVAPEQQEITETEEHLEDQVSEGITVIHAEQLSDTVTEDSQKLTFNTGELKQYVLENYHPDEKQPDNNGKQYEVLEPIEKKDTTEIMLGLHEQEEIMECSESSIEEQVIQEADHLTPENQEIPLDLHNQFDSHTESKKVSGFYHGHVGGRGIEQDDVSLPEDQIVEPDSTIAHADTTAEDTTKVAAIVSEPSELSETHFSTDQKEIQETESTIVESPESIDNIAENAPQLTQTSTKLESSELFDTPEVPPATDVDLDSQTVDDSEVKTGEIATESEFVEKAVLDTTEITEMAATFEPEKSTGSEFEDNVTQNASDTQELSVPEEQEIPEAISDTCEDEIGSGEQSPVPQVMEVDKPQLKITETAPDYYSEQPNDYGVYEQFAEDEVTLSTAIAEDPDSSTANSLASLDMDDTTVLKQSYAVVKTTAETKIIPEDDNDYNDELDETEERADALQNINDVIHPDSRIHPGSELPASTIEKIPGEDHAEELSTTSPINDAIHEDLEAQNSNDVAEVDPLSALQAKSQTLDYIEPTHISNDDDLLEANRSDHESATTNQTDDAIQKELEPVNYKEDQTDINVDSVSEEKGEGDQRGELEDDTGDKEEICDEIISDVLGTVEHVEDTTERPESPTKTVVDTSITTIDNNSGCVEESNTLVEIEHQRACHDENKQELTADSSGEAVPKHLTDDQTPVETPLDESSEAYGSKDLVETQTVLQDGETSPVQPQDCVDDDETPIPGEVLAPSDFNDLHDDKMSAQVAVDEESDDDVHQLRMRLHRLRSTDDFVSEIVGMHRNLNELDTSFEVTNTSGADDNVVATDVSDMDGRIENGDRDFESGDLNNNGKSNKLLETLNDLSSAVESKTKPVEVTVQDNNNEMLENLKNEFNLELGDTNDQTTEQKSKLKSILSDNEIITRDENGNVGGPEQPESPRKRVSFSSRPIVIQGDGRQEPIVTSDDGASSADDDVMALMS